MEEDTKKAYYDKVHFIGIVTLSVSLLFFLGINLYLSFALDLHPGWQAILAGFLSVAAVVGHTWVNISDIFLFLLLMGPAGTYMAQLTGNVKNMRLPSAMAACSMLENQAPQLKRDILATYGVGISVVVNTAALVVLVIAGKHVLELLPSVVLRGIDYVVPAMFGAILAQFSLRNVKVAIVSMLAVLVVVRATAIPTFLSVIISILLAIALNVMIEKRGKRRAEQQEEEDSIR